MRHRNFTHTEMSLTQKYHLNWNVNKKITKTDTKLFFSAHKRSINKIDQIQLIQLIVLLLCIFLQILLRLCLTNTLNSVSLGQISILFSFQHQNIFLKGYDVSGHAKTNDKTKDIWKMVNTNYPWKNLLHPSF